MTSWPPRPKEDPVTVMLADNNPLMLTAMAEIFEKNPRFSLVATSATAEGFLGAVMRMPVQVGVIDWNLPGRSIFGRERPLADATLQIGRAHV